MNKITCCCFVVLYFCLILPSTGNSQNADFKQKVETVLGKLIASIDKVPANIKWPPKIIINETSDLNASAHIEDGQPYITVNTGLTKITDDVPDRLAYIIAHELTHIIKGHCSRKLLSEKNALASTFSNEDEKEADVEGLKLFLKSGYSYTEAINTFKILRQVSGDYSPLEAQSKDHPSWTERLSYIDEKEELLWRSMSAFQNGVSFLLFQNYKAASNCFINVVTQFPKCYEAYANLGYAYLMQYCDLLDKEDINYFGIGQIVVGGFYRRPQSLEGAVRGMDEQLWYKAIKNYNDALKIKPDLSLAESYLGIAYFLDPEKKSINLSLKFLDKSLNDFESDKTTDPFLKASILVNMCAIEIAMGNDREALSKLDKVQSICNTKENDSNSIHYSNSFGIVNSETQLENSMIYNSALIEYKKNNGALGTKTLKDLLKYLRSFDCSSVWWNLAYKMYQEGSVKSGHSSLTTDQLLAEVSNRTSPVKSITVNGFTIYLSQEMKEITTMYKKTEKIPIVEDKNIFEYMVPEYSLSIIGDDNVLGIKIKGNTPEIKFDSDNPLYSSIKTGQSFSSLKKQFDGMSFSYITMPGSIKNKYFFIADLGLAFEVSNSFVKEIFIVQKPIN
jgi:hypothetical protein